MSLRQALLAFRRGEIARSELQKIIDTRKYDEVAHDKAGMSRGQSALLAYQSSHPHSTAYNVPLCYDIQGTVISEHVSAAFRHLLHQHPELACAFSLDGPPSKRVTDVALFAISEKDVSSFREAEREALLAGLVTRPFDLGVDKAMTRCFLIKRSPTRYWLLFVFHHLVIDGYSISAIERTFFGAYKELASARTPVLQTGRWGYQKFVSWQQDYLLSEQSRKDRTFWLETLRGNRALQGLMQSPLANGSGPDVQTFNLEHAVPIEQAQQVRLFGAGIRVQPSSVFLGTYLLVLWYFSRQPSVVVGMPTRARPSLEFDDIVGFFANMIAINQTVDFNESIEAFLRAVQRAIANGVDHSYYPHASVLSDLGVDHSLEWPLFEQTFEYQSMSLLHEAEIECEPLAVKRYRELQQTGGYPLVLTVSEAPTEYRIQLRYKETYVDERWANSFLEKYCSALEVLLEGGRNRILRDIASAICKDDWQRLTQRNVTKAEYAEAGPLNLLIARQANVTPMAKAVSYRDRSLSYADLESGATVLATRLARLGVRPGDVVAIHLERDIEMVTCLLALFKCGAAYLPIDLEWPQERVRIVVGRAKVTLVLTEERHAEMYSEYEGRLSYLSVLIESASNQPWGKTDEPGSFASGYDIDALAYVIYTSGSTGEPKGCAISHRAISNRLLWMRKQYAVGISDRILQKTPLSFDVSVWELFLPLIAGAELVLADHNGHRDSAYLANVIQCKAITMCHFVPSMLRTFLTETGKLASQDLRDVFVSGESLSPELMRAFRRQSTARLHNLYGPTEAAIDVSYWKCEERIDGKVPIGRPIDNAKLYVLDKWMLPVPDGVIGELYIGGPVLAVGYLHDPERTAARFIESPLIDGERLYRTGDLVSWLPDGNIEFHGREDGQIKIRGYRVELQEIENATLIHGSVENAAAVFMGRDTEDAHIELVFSATAGDISEEDIRSHLIRQLPWYCVPSRLLKVASLPLTASGKLDKRAVTQILLASTVPPQECASDSPNDVEERVARIWCKTLQRGNVNWDEGFLQAGGTSILAIQVACRIRTDFAVPFEVVDLFRCATIKKIAEHVAREHHSQSAAENKTAKATAEASQSVAILGISCTLPDASSPHQFWKNLITGIESVRPSAATGVSERQGSDSRLISHCGRLANRERFDAAFFRISDHDAGFMDPQMRLLLESAWSAIEDAGYATADLGRTGVFVCASNTHYLGSSFVDGITIDSPERYLAWTYSQPGSYPTIISHRLGLIGPSTFIHSNCSSSLVALDAAVKALQSGEVDYALVCAACVSPHNMRGYVFQEGMNFSSDGHVRTFDMSADGMVPGEAVCALLLCRTEQAQASKDHIYAVLRSIAVNNDGAEKMGFYAPSELGQAAVIEQSIRKAKIDPRSIGYVEAHGTATRIGDPIEIAALSRAWRIFTKERQCCAIGSVKSNVGHTDVAAGLVGCIKAVLSLKYQKIPPSLNFSRVNPLLKLEETPFFVASSLREFPKWGTEARRAAVSSFGIGGTNAHAIFEEAPVRLEEAQNELELVVVPLSAQDRHCLRKLADGLAEWLDLRSNLRLRDIAHTLQNGRMAMPVRIAFGVHSIDELVRDLRAFTANENPYDDRDLTRSLPQDVIRWLTGGSLDWKTKFSLSGAMRIPLPTYPFAGRSYPRMIHGHPSPQSKAQAGLRRTTLIQGDEWFVNDHTIDGIHVLAGVFLLEEARKAIYAARSASAPPDPAWFKITDFCWLAPVLNADKGAVLEAIVTGQLDVDMQIRVLSGELAGSERKMSCCECRAQSRNELRYEAEDAELLVAPSKLSQASHGTYEDYSSQGYNYGASLRLIDQIWVGESHGRAIVRAAIVLPTDKLQFGYPLLIEAALQATIKLPGISREPAMPFAIDECEFLMPIVGRRYFAVVRWSDSESSGVRKIDINICDIKGVVTIRIRGYSTRVISQSAPYIQQSNKMELAIVSWEASPIAAGADRGDNDPFLVINGGSEVGPLVASQHPAASYLQIAPESSIAEVAELLRASEPLKRIVWLSPSAVEFKLDDSVLDAQEEGAIALFRFFKALYKLGYESRILNILVVTERAIGIAEGDSWNPSHATIHGLAGVVAKEQSNWSLQIIDTDSFERSDLCTMWAMKDRPGDTMVLRGQTAYWPTLVPWRRPCRNKVSYRDEGVYIVVGGAGGLGQVWTERVLREHRAHVFWLGRREEDEEIRAAIDRLSSLGPAPIYISADATEPSDLQRVLTVVKERHQAVHGIVHSVLLLEDKSLQNMSESQFRSVTRSKIDSALRTIEILGNEQLDFILFFSSVQYYGRALGQANYAAGCVFLNELARRVAQTATYPVKIINWGYWGAVGAVSAKRYRDQMVAKNVGSIEPDAGMWALDCFMETTLTEVCAVSTDLNESWAALPLTRSRNAVVYPAQNGGRFPKVELPRLTNIRPPSPELLWDPRAANVVGLLAKITRAELQTLNGAKDDPNRQVLTKFEPWFHETKRRLSMIDSESPWTTDVTSAWSRWREFVSSIKEKEELAQFAFIERVLKKLTEVLTGECSAVEALFEDGTPTLLETVYKGSRLANFYNEQAAKLVVSWLKECHISRGSKRVRILEIGAGTGATTRHLLSAFRQNGLEIDEYWFTDISQSLIEQAKSADDLKNPFIRFRRFDLNKSPMAQGIDPGHFSLVIGANVIHATRDIRKTLLHVKTTLETGGLLLMAELGTVPLAAHLSFGLLDGWWNFDDHEVRVAGSPQVTAESWERLLRETGFRDMKWPIPEIHELGQVYITAVSDGVCIEDVAAERDVDPASKEVFPDRSALKSEPSDDVHSRFENYILQQVGAVLRRSEKEIKRNESWALHGMDSIVAVQLANLLRPNFSGIRSTIFFEHSSAAELASYLLETQLDAVLHVLAASERNTVRLESTSSGDDRKTDSSVGNLRKLADRCQRSGGDLPSTQLAIIGVGLRYPDASTLDEFWENLKSGRDSVREVPADRWSLRGFYEPDPTDAIEECRSYSKWGSFLDGFAEFDPEFFGISRFDALSMDPQERIFLQVAWEAIENAAYTRERFASEYKSNVGVFVGMSKTGFELYGPPAWKRRERFFPKTSFSSVANRISYLFNLTGPSLAVDTMCSSSLTAVHEAAAHILRGECELALAGGVCLNLHPAAYIGLSEQRVLSPTGKCRSFAQGADGMVPGEGAGAILIKRYEDAKRDGDNIYAVIMGSAVNHGGRARGYTVPNPQSQARLITAALAKANVRPRNVSYVEAHGTGTELGDPIEIAGLTIAYEADTRDRQYCRVGSLKSNLGHLEAAAGIAGITKVLLQLRHRTFVPSLHCQVSNQQIDFSSTPFYLGTDVTEWRALNDQPRVAGVSSFGAGGANAHIVLAENPESGVQEIEGMAGRGHWIVVSARTMEQRKRSARQLVQYLRSYGSLAISDVAYTLQVGREAMRWRLAVFADCLASACKKLEQFDSGHSDKDIYVSHGEVDAQPNNGNPASFSDEILGELWIKGTEIDWETIIWQGRGRRISLPTYPFDRQKFWDVARRRLDTRGHDDDTDANTANSVPLNLELLGPILDDHQVAKVAMVPASCYIQLVTTAVSERILIPEGHVLQLRNLAWLEPILQVDSRSENLSILFSRQSIREYLIKIATTGVDPPATHFVCTAQVVASSNQKGRMTDLRPALTIRLSNHESYQLLKESGVDCGPLLRGVQEVRISLDGLFAEAVVESPLADSRLRDSLDNYRVTIMLDAALQVSHLMSTVSRSDRATTTVPFALDSISLYREIPARAIARVRRETLDGAIGEKVYLELLDPETSLLCVAMNGLTGRETNTTATKCKPFAFEPNLIPVDKENTNLNQSAVFERRVIAFIQDPGLVVHQVDLDGQIADRLHLLVNKEMEHETQYEQVTTLLLEMISALVEEAGAQNVLFQLGLCGSHGERFTGLEGLLGCIAQEYPVLHFQVVVIDEPVLTQTVLEQLVTCRQLLPQRRVELRLGRPHIRSFSLAKETEEPMACWRRDGVYLITGGLGGLGRIVARDIAEQAGASHIILVGRSAVTGANSEFLKSLERNEGSVNYFRADVSNRESLRPVVEHIRKSFGSLDGVIHCAGIMKAMFTRRASRSEVSMVLAPKVAGTINLRAAVSSLNPDIFVLFSSAVTGVPVTGMGVYAAANGFMDAMANVWNREETYKGASKTKFISVAWPIWRDGGMRLQRPDEYISLKALHLAEMPTNDGLRCLYGAIASERTHSIVLYAETAEHAQSALDPYRADSATQVDLRKKRQRQVDQVTRGEVASIVRDLLANALMITKEELRSSTPLSNVGITSIVALQVIGHLEKKFGLLPKTLLFEYSTIDAVADYLMARQQGNQAIEQSGSTTNMNKGMTREMDTMILPLASRNSSDVAIIGVAGRYPQAEDICEFWDNIVRGKDCVTEVPDDRWDHNRYFHPEKGTPGKTYSKWGGFLGDVATFDAEFFNISPREAALMDPQERLFLMTAYHAIEDAAYSADYLSSGVSKNVGVFAAVMYEEYQLLGPQGSGGALTPVLGSSAASIANRVSYYFDLQGPSMTIDTMCSSSLTAIHLACQSLMSGECAAALAGGVNLNLHPNKYLGLAQGRFASSDGRCKAFAENADGYVPSEGVGVVLLKPLAQAKLDHDRIYGVIKATGINHGGRTNGYTVPSAAAQSRLISSVLDRAGVEAQEISYVEAHGTGTQLGDPLEINGLTHAFRKFTLERQFCSIGSVKTNIGHCESAAGIAGLTKVLLQMRHRRIAPSLYSSEPNAYIAFEETPFRLQTQAGSWDPPTLNGKVGNRIAAVSSFGAGGSNAHIVVREPQEDETRSFCSLTAEYVVIPLSAREPEILQRVAKLLLDQISESDSASLQDIAYTLQVGRAPMRHRVAWVVHSVQELKQVLCVYLEQDQAARHRRESAASSPARYEMLMQLSKKWMEGGRVDWDALYEKSNRPYRTRLPLYPFKQVRHWVNDVLNRATTNHLAEEKVSRSQPATPPSMISALTARRPTSLSTTTADVSVVLRDTLARALYYEEAQMDLNATFAELGLDSVVAVEWIKEVNQQLRTSLSTAVIYEYTTLQLLADHIAQSPLGGLPGETTEGIFAGAPPISSIQDDRKSEHLDVEGVFARVYSGELSVADALQTMRV